MTEDDINEIIFDGGLAQYMDPKHPEFDIDTALLLIFIRPDLFSDEEIELVQNSLN